MTKVFLVDRDGSRIIAPESFPIRLGEGSGVDLQVPVTGSPGVYAVIGIKERRLYFQPKSLASVRHNGAPADGPRWLANGDRLAFDVSVVEIRIESGLIAIEVLAASPEYDSPMGGRTVAARARAGVATASPGAAVYDCIADVIRTRREKGEAAEAVLGRHESCHVVLRQATVSKRHAIVALQPDGRYVVRDLSSTNGTFVNGRRIAAPTVIGDDDRIIIGSYLLSLGGVAKDFRRESAIRAVGLEKVYPGGVVGLHACDLEVSAGALVAIMGPSGCGKSTLMRCLNGDSPGTRGSVLLHGLDLIENYEYLKTRIGYVPQDDIVHGQLTVEQSLFFAGKLRLGKVSGAELEAKIAGVLRELKIERVRHQRISALSGGQRKRVSIAVELLSDPLILFLDEPTSPLDPQTIEEFLGILRGLASQGTTVVMVTHKPEDLHFMDSVVFLAEGGHVVYHAGTDGCAGYFGVPHMSGVFSRITADHAQQWIDRYRIACPVSGGGGRQSPGNPLPRLKNQSALTQLKWLCLRYMRIKCNDRSNVLLLIMQPLTISIAMCVVFASLNMGVLFFSAISAVWLGVNNAAREIVGELPIYRRERMFNLGIGPYLASKVIVLALIAAAQCALFVAILLLGFLGAEPCLSAPVGYFLWMWLVSTVSSSMGLFVSAWLDRNEKVMTVVPIMLIPQIMLAGVLERMRGPLVEVASYATFSRWATEGFAIVQGEVDGVIDPGSLPALTGPVDAIRGAEPERLAAAGLGPNGGLHANYHMELFECLPGYGTLGLDLAALTVLMGGFLGLALCFLRRMDAIR